MNSFKQTNISHVMSCHVMFTLNDMLRCIKRNCDSSRSSKCSDVSATDKGKFAPMLN
jgi:hypothetical protein